MKFLNFSLVDCLAVLVLHLQYLHRLPLFFWLPPQFTYNYKLSCLFVMSCDDYFVLWSSFLIGLTLLLQAGYTALHLAASRGHLEVVRALLVASRSVNNQDKIVSNFLI